MKKLLLNSLTTAFFLSLILVVSCGGNKDDDPGSTPNEDQFALLEGTWTLSSVTNEGNQVSGWEGFTITIGGSADNMTFTTGGTQPDGTTDVWENGSFTFGSDVNTLNRNDNVEVTIAVTETQLTANFNIADPNGRAEEVFGAWIFVFAK